jgi:hypothetical protein
MKPTGLTLESSLRKLEMNDFWGEFRLIDIYLKKQI